MSLTNEQMTAMYTNMTKIRMFEERVAELFAEGKIPMKFSEDGKGVVWKAELPGRGCSTPIVKSGLLLLTAPVDGKDSLMAFDLNGNHAGSAGLGSGAINFLDIKDFTIKRPSATGAGDRLNGCDCLIEIVIKLPCY